MAEKILAWLSSTRLALFLLIVVTAASIAGIALPRVFSSYGYDGLLFALSLNLLACLLKRLAGRLSFSGPWRSNLKAAGSLCFHAGILLLLAGGLWGRLKGYSVLAELADGDSFQVPGAPFSVRSDGFSIEWNSEGKVRQYRTRLSLLAPDSSVILRREIKVNDPLSYRGVRFTQASFDKESERIRDALLRISRLGADSFSYEGTFPFRKAVVVPGTGITAAVTGFWADFVFDTESRTPASRSTEHRNPAIRVTFSDKRGFVTEEQWAFLQYPGAPMARGTCRVALLGYTPAYLTGIQIKKSPGASLIWAGLVVMTLGVLVMFCVPQRRE